MNRLISERRVLRFGAALLLCALSACGGGKGDKDAGNAGGASKDAGSPVNGDWVVIQAQADPENLNFIVGTDTDSREVNTYILEALTLLDYETLQRIPWIADSLPTVSEDHLTYEFPLRKDVKFSDGHPLTAEDFIFTLKAIKNPHIENSQILAGYYADVDRAELVNGDPHRLRFVMKKPYFVADQVLGELVALPKHVWDPTNLSDKYTFDELNNMDPNKNPAMTEFATSFEDIKKAFDPKYIVGSGPYKLESFRRNERLILARNDQYWNNGNRWGKQFPDKILFRTIQDQNAAVAALKGGEVDVVPVMNKVIYVNEKPRFPENSLKPAEYDFPTYNYVGYNAHNPLFKDKAVRQALARVIDRDAIIKSVYFDMARPVQAPVFAKRPEYDSTLPVIKYNLDEAKKMLAAAGWADSDGDGTLDKVIDGKKTDFDFTLMYPNASPTAPAISLILRDAFQKVGIKVTTSAIDWALFLKRTRDGDYQAYIGGWSMDVTEGDPFQLWHSASTKGGSNYVFFENKQADSLIMAIRSEFDVEKRRGLWKEFQSIVNEEQPYNFLVMPLFTGAYHNRFENVKFYPPRPCYLAGTWWVPTTARRYTAQKPVAAR